YGSYASSLTVAQNDSPRYDKALYAMPGAPQSSVALQVPGSVSGGQQFTATVEAPDGWTVSPRSTPPVIALIPGGTSAKFTWSVTAPGSVAKVNALIGKVKAVQGGHAQAVTDERIVGSIP